MVAEPRVSLARRFGPVVSASISVLLLCSHALFAFAQYASALEDCPTLPQLPNFTSACDATNQLLLARVDANVHVGFEARGLIATALGYVEQQQCNTSCPEEYPAVSQLSPLCSMLACDSCTSAGPIDLAVGGCHVDFTDTLLTVSTFGSIYMLWFQDRDPLCLSGNEPTCTGTYPYRLAGARIGP